VTAAHLPGTHTVALISGQVVEELNFGNRLPGRGEAPHVTSAYAIGEAVVAAMGAAGSEYLFFTSGSELCFYQEAIAKARAAVRQDLGVAEEVPESMRLDTEPPEQ
jgi:hypothetical protein